MAFDEMKFQDVMGEFSATTEMLREVAGNFRQDLQIGLRDVASSSMRMLKSYVGLPTGKETGEFLGFATVLKAKDTAKLFATLPSR